MSVDLDALSENPPPPEPVAAAPEPPPAPEPPVDPDEAVAVEIQGGKHVPLSALKSVREENKALKEQASRLPQLEQALAQMQGRVATFEQLQQQLRPQMPAPTGPVPDDPELVELARSLDYINPTTGQPDLERASKHMALIERRAQRIAQTALKPMQDQSARSQSAANYHAVQNMTAPNGVKPSKEMIDWMWQNLPAEYTANPQVAAALPALAIGLDVLRGAGSKLPTAPAPPNAPPLHTEGAQSSAPRRAVPISDAERSVIGARGMKEDDYVKATKNFVKGRPTVLDED